MSEILLTGSGGFLGQHLQAAFLPGQCVCPRSSELDLLDAGAVEEYVSATSSKTIIHAAGFVGGIGLNKAHPGQMLMDNLRMGLNVLGAAAKVQGVRVCIVSTVCVYPQDAPIPTPETSMFAGYPADETAFYGIAKRTLLTAAEGLRREFGLQYVYVIPTNLYGPGDHYDEQKSHVVPALIRRAQEAVETGVEEFVAWGDGTQTRDLLYVGDAVEGILASLKPEGQNEVFNLGAGVEISVRSMVETICEVVGYRGSIVWDTTKPGGAPRRALDASKAFRVLGFRPKTTFAEGVKRAHDWFMANRETLS